MSRNYYGEKKVKNAKASREGPFGPLVPPLKSGLRVVLVQTSLMSLGVFFLILKYAFQETELGRSLQPQRLLLAEARSARRTRQP